jgi:hypothetical protein
MTDVIVNLEQKFRQNTILQSDRTYVSITKASPSCAAEGVARY